MFEIPDVCGCLLLVLPTRLAQTPCAFLVDQWVADDGWGLDDWAFGDFCGCFVGLVIYYAWGADNTSSRQGTGQLVIAGAGIYHPEWVATPWQTCTGYGFG